MNVLFLCTELSGYFLNCIYQFRKQQPCHIILIHYPSPSIAPFEPKNDDIEMRRYDSLQVGELKEFCISANPTIVYVAGWINKEYVSIARILKKRGAVVVAGVDNPWRGTFRQRIACVLAPIIIQPAFTYLWVAGNSQYAFASRLGFLPQRILTGLYTANVDKFSGLSGRQMEKYLVFVGRFERVKGVHVLVKAFQSLSLQDRKGWKLKLIGNGPLKNELTATDDIELYGFMQPEDLISFVSDSGGFVLPSLAEPWGVVVHEFASAGKPLLLSDAVNSGEQFLISGYNGYRFKKNDVRDLNQKLKSFFELDESQRIQMGQRSNQLAQRWNPEFWAQTLVSVIPLDTSGVSINRRL